MELKWVLQTGQELLKQQISEFSNQFSKLKSSFKTEIKFSNHKSIAKSICFQITYAEIPCDGPLAVTGRTLYSYRSGSHVLSIFLFALILLVRVRNGVWCSVRLVLGLGIGFGLALG